MDLTISSAILAEIQQQARGQAPQEICGLLLGENGQVTVCRPTANVASDPVHHFEIDPAALIVAEREQRGGGLSIIGYYHSHPGGSVRPSATDARSAAPDGRFWLIVNGQEAAAWRTADAGEIYDRFDAIRLDCFDPKGQTAAN